MENAIILVATNMLEDMLESSSSSDSETEEQIILLALRGLKPSIKTTIKVIASTFTEQEFKQKFRMNRITVEYLTERFVSSGWYLRRTYKGGRKQMAAENHLLSYLWYCGNKISLNEMAKIFKTSLSGLHAAFEKVMDFLTEYIAKEVIKFPEDDIEKAQVASDFEMIASFPDVLGCIDNTEISIRRSKQKIITDYENHYNGTTIAVQAICDAQLRFLDVHIGDASKYHKSELLKLSAIGKQLPKICGKKYHLLGDSAYPLQDYLLTPYKDNEHLGESEELYNWKFTYTYEQIEHSFSMLKNRFQRLMHLEFRNVKMIPKFILSCCALHNICIDRNDYLDVDLENIVAATVNRNVSQSSSFEATTIGQSKRSKIKNMLFNQTCG